MNLENLLKQEEGKQLEFKRDLSSPKGIIQTVVAFANTAGGCILIGIEDETKAVVGVENPLKEEERLSHLIFDSILPRIVPNIELLSWRGLYVLKVEVFLSTSRPHYLEAKGVEEGVYMRVGSTNRKVGVDAVDEMKREILRKPFDEQALVEYGSDVIDFKMALELFKPERSLSKRDLETLKLIVEDQGRKVPTVAGMILFGTAREEVFPDAWIQCGFFKGKDKVSIVDVLEIHEYPVMGVEKAMEFIKKHSNLAYEIGGLRRTEKWSRPLMALREALINAVVHCDYSQKGMPIRLSIFEDRIEIENPGLLVSGLTIEGIQEGVSKLRNRNIARVFKELKLIEQWGSGIQKIKKSCESCGFKAPMFEETGLSFRVTIYMGKVEKALLLREKELEILRFLVEEEGMRTKELSKAIGLSAKATIVKVKGLVNKNLVAVVGKSMHDPKRRYVITDKGKEAVQS